MSKLEQSIEALAAAAQAFDEALTEEYKAMKRHNRPTAPGASPEVRLYDRIESLLGGSVYSKVQWRAIHGARAGWHPPQVRPVQSLPLTGRSGGVA
ncbi:hypothetical protein [Synechocystis sp. LKSZ1]|uniref:hypothetical protein n=1 Tax=Synechocystis sp. LKSZ1 TaxID=3144951 RepID=UPI00336BD90E